MNKCKRAISLMLTGIMVVCMSITAFASESGKNELINVSMEAPLEETENDVALYGLVKRGTDKVTDLNSSALTFAGHASGSTLYTNKHFTGKNSIGYSITNDCDEKLTVKFYTSSGWFKSKAITIEANATLTGTIDGLDSDKLYYLTFSAPSDFSGSVY